MNFPCEIPGDELKPGMVFNCGGTACIVTRKGNIVTGEGNPIHVGGLSREDLPGHGPWYVLSSNWRAYWREHFHDPETKIADIVRFVNGAKDYLIDL